MDPTEKDVRTQRPPSYAELLVDSLDRYTDGFAPYDYALATSSSDWSLNFQRTVLSGYFTRIGVTQVNFQWNLPTIIPGYNNSFDITVGATPYTIDLSGGFYTPNELADQIELQLNTTTGETFAVSFTENYFDIDLGDFFEIVAPTTPLQKRTFETLGLTKSSGTFMIGQTPSLLPTRFIDICSSYLTKFQKVKDTTSLKAKTTQNVIARIYPIAPNTRYNITGTDAPGARPFNICIDYNTPKWIKWSPDEAMNNFDLQLRDDSGNILPFISDFYGTQCEYQLTLLASET